MIRFARPSNPIAPLVAVLAALLAQVDIGTRVLFESLSRQRARSPWSLRVWAALTCQAGVIGRGAVLTQKRTELLKEASGLVEKPDASSDDRARVETILGEVKGIDGELTQIEAVNALHRAAPATARVSVHERVEDDPKLGFRTLGDFARSVRGATVVSRGLGGTVDPRLAYVPVAAPSDQPGFGLAVPPNAQGIVAAPTGYMQEAHGAGGEGYSVPPAFSSTILELSFAEDDLLFLSQPEPTDGNAVEWLADESTPWGATGVKFYWGPEAGQMTPSKTAESDRMLRLHKGHVFITATEELLQDDARLTDRLTRKSAQAITWGTSEAIMRGTGAGQPKGWEAAPAVVTVGKETSPAQGAATLVPQNLLKMRSRLWMGPGARPVWLANSDIMPQLADLRIGNEPSWISRERGLVNALETTLLGFPIRFTEHANTLGTTGDIQLVNLAGYYATMRKGGVQFAQSMHLYFDYGLQAFRWTIRIGGQPYLAAPITPANGSNTKSHFVYLQTR